METVVFSELIESLERNWMEDCKSFTGSDMACAQEWQGLQRKRPTGLILSLGIRSPGCDSKREEIHVGSWLMFGDMLVCILSSAMF